MRGFGRQTWARFAEITAPVAFPIVGLALGGSIATPPGGIEAEVIEAASFEELASRGDAVRGKIVLWNRRMRADGGMDGYGAVAPLRIRGASEAAKLGAVASLVRSLGTADFRLPHTGAMRYQADVPRIPAAAITSEDADRLHRLLGGGEPGVQREDLGVTRHLEVVHRSRWEVDHLQHGVGGEHRRNEFVGVADVEVVQVLVERAEHRLFRLQAGQSRLGRGEPRRQFLQLPHSTSPVLVVRINVVRHRRWGRETETYWR